MINEVRFKKFNRAYELQERQYLKRQNNHFSVGQIFKSTRNFFEYQFLPHYAAAPPFWRLMLRQFNPNRPLPDFAVVGPIKSGSSDLVTHLLLHPCVLPPLAKEIFSPEPETWRPYYPTTKERQKVEQKEGQALSGFLAPFMHWIHLQERYHEIRPDAKIIILLREPVERAFSHWKWEVLLGGTMVKHMPYYQDFGLFVKMALSLFPDTHMDSLCGFPFLESGIYYKSVQRWIDLFGRNQVLALDMNSYFRDRTQTLNQIQDFLAIPRADISGDNTPINQNPLKKKKMEEKTREDLINFYQPFNEKLYSVINARFGW
ncbi:MAG: hypothetical protein EHM72_09080 [Calditrichaeota bacterium]|nr:MAG: hypothetical protein EHM72_09080 [Calditrichota bacterium]